MFETETPPEVIEAYRQHQTQLEQRQSQAQEKEASEKPFVAFLPGINGGGRVMTTIRQELERLCGPDLCYVPPSISSGNRKKGETADAYHQSLASEIGKRAGSRDVVVVGQSMGGWQSENTISHLVDNPDWTGNKITAHYLSPIGYSKEGFQNYGEVFGDFLKLGKQADLNQHVAYPLPEGYYQDAAQDIQESDLKTLYEDTPEKRAERRTLFIRRLPKLVKDPHKFMQQFHKRVPDADEIESPEDALGLLDSKLSRALVTGEPNEELLETRSKLLEDPIEGLFQGDHIPDEIHQEYLKKNNDLTEYSAPILWQLYNIGLYMKDVRKDLYKGMDKNLAALIKKAQVRGKTFQFDFVLPERDVMVGAEDVPLIRERFSGVPEIRDAFRGFYSVKNWPHSGMGISPEPLESIIALGQNRGELPPNPDGQNGS